MRISVSALVPILAALLAVGPGSEAEGQAGLPGSEGRPAEAFRAEFDAYVLARVDTLMTGWHAGWREDRAGAVSALYGDRSLLILPDGVPLLGPGEIEARLSELLPSVGAFRASRLDYGASERLAFVSGPYELELAAGAAGGAGTVTGRHVTVFMREDDRWRIRAQVFFGNGEGPALADDGRVGGPLDPSHALRALEDRGNWEAYYERTYDRVGRAVSDVARAWREGEIGEASRFYADGALLRTPSGEELRSPSAIRRWLEEVLPGAGDVRMALLDFDASGRLAFAHGRYLLAPGWGGGRGSPVLGPFVLIFGVGRDTKIRLHVLGRDPG